MILSKVKDLRPKQIVSIKEKRSAVWEACEQRRENHSFQCGWIEDRGTGGMIAGLVSEERTTFEYVRMLR